MRIAFVGKGGSGKTTLASLFSRFLAKQKLPVITIDADINQHMATALGLEEQVSVPVLGAELPLIKDYLRNSNSRIASHELMIKTTPPGSGSHLIQVQERNPLYDYFERSSEDVRLLSVGSFTEEDLGTKCYHSKTGSVELLLNHLVDGKGEYVVVDMTAGSDSFASGMFTKFDLTVLVVEPTLKSLSVYKQYAAYAKRFNVSIRVVGNKIESADDVAFIRAHVGHVLIGSFRNSPYVRAMEKGRFLPFSELEGVNQEILAQILNVLDVSKKDWTKFYEQMKYFHIENAKSWANAQLGVDLTLQIDPAFVFPECL
jgi:CO dehydrogenase maturation factor